MKQALPWMENGLLLHNLPAPAGLIRCHHVLDVGAGVRPMQWYRPKRHACLEAYGPYADLLEKAGYEVVRGRAQDLLHEQKADAVYLLDVIEHMTREDGKAVIDAALHAAVEQVVIFTPIGFMPQEADAWGLGGDIWQKHRSGWTGADFPGWQISTYGRGFFAITRGRA